MQLSYLPVFFFFLFFSSIIINVIAELLAGPCTTYDDVQQCRAAHSGGVCNCDSQTDSRQTRPHNRSSRYDNAEPRQHARTDRQLHSLKGQRVVELPY